MDLGTKAELKFDSRAHEHDIDSARFVTQNMQVDRICLHGPTDTKTTVQIKATATLDTRNRYAVRVRRAKNKKYRKEAFDILAAYVEPLDVWYLIPREALGNKSTVALYPHRDDIEGVYEKYRERWQVFDERAKSKYSKKSRPRTRSAG